MALTVGLLATLEAKPGKEKELESFLISGRDIVEAETGTVVWYAFRIDERTFGIFDAFESEESRQAHLGGEIPKALGEKGAELLASDPVIRPVEVLASKP